jgi:hypothetical protein
MICSYGCGNEAGFIIGRNSRPCCSNRFMRCPMVLAKASQSRTATVNKKWETTKTKVCGGCLEEKDIEEGFHKRHATGRPYSLCKVCNTSRLKEWERTHPERVREANRRCHRTPKQRANKRAGKHRLREAVLTKFGNKCSWPGCDWNDPRALQIDHVHGGGSAEQKAMKRCTVKLYKKVLGDTTGMYQLLCANHNMIRRYEEQQNVSPDHPLVNYSIA